MLHPPIPIRKYIWGLEFIASNSSFSLLLSHSLSKSIQVGKAEITSNNWSSTAAAPSFSVLALAAVTVPGSINKHDIRTFFHTEFTWVNLTNYYRILPGLLDA